MFYNDFYNSMFPLLDGIQSNFGMDWLLLLVVVQGAH
jgi:hypothetical protein